MITRQVKLLKILQTRTHRWRYHMLRVKSTTAIIAHLTFTAFPVVLFSPVLFTRRADKWTPFSKKCVAISAFSDFIRVPKPNKMVVKKVRPLGRAVAQRFPKCRCRDARKICAKLSVCWRLVSMFVVLFWWNEIHRNTVKGSQNLVWKSLGNML